MTKVLIFGAGGVGCIYAYILHKAGCRVITVCRTNYEIVKKSGITVRSQLWGKQHFQPQGVVRAVAEAIDNDDDQTPFDYILVCSKALPGTSSSLISPAVTPSHTVIVLAQNGIQIEAEYQHLYPTNPIISGVVYLPTTQVSPGIIEMGPLERFEIGMYPSPSAPDSVLHQPAKTLSQLFTLGSATAVFHTDIQPRRWIKLGVNASWNPICALTLCDDANFLRSSTTTESIIISIFNEISSLATVSGYPNLITPEVVNEHLDRARKRLETGGKEPSMLTDVRHGRAMEVEAILGNAVRIGRERGVEVPRLELLYVLAKGLQFAILRGEGWKDGFRVE